MTIKIHIKAKEVQIHTDCEQGQFMNVLDGLADHLEAIAQHIPYHKKGESTMALNAEQTAIVKRFDDATTAISDELDALIAAGPNSPEFMTKLQGIADGLDLLGKKVVPGPGPQPTP